ncbi:hypothetical protein [Sinorhizobium meliloti]|uniref:hypothetical protein n=1 Tax=Rhizobium meliloti TaxID=382 RepID=UPI001F26AE8C|nr:hypothetical protein [Sinorhizobium meliloti]
MKSSYTLIFLQIMHHDGFTGLLLRYGADCIGAVSIRPPGDAAQLPEATVSPGRTVSGVQKKLLVTKDDENRFVPASATGSALYI